MDRADKQSGQINRFFYKFLLVISPSTALVNSAASLLYNKLIYGDANPNNLFRNLRFVYVNMSQISNICFKFSKV